MRYETSEIYVVITPDDTIFYHIFTDIKEAENFCEETNDKAEKAMKMYNHRIFTPDELKRARPYRVKTLDDVIIDIKDIIYWNATYGEDNGVF